MDSLSLAPKQSQQYQHVLVMRHGDRIDELVDSWLSNATGPWDPPLVDAGCVRAFHTGAKLRTQLGFPIHRVFVSPFMRCIETASGVVSALCAIREDSNAVPRTDMPIDPSKIKVSIEYGISEIFNGMSIKTPPKDGEWGFNVPELELKFPAGTLDPEFEPVVKELPKWGETSSDAYARFGRVIHALADRYPSENLLFITHGAGLRATAWTFLNGTEVHKVEYCAYIELERQIILNDSNSFIAGKFGVVSHHGY